MECQYAQIDLNSYVAKYVDEMGCSLEEACEELGIDLSKEGIHNMSKVDFDLFKQSIGDSNKISTPEYEVVKSKFIGLMKYIITGVE